MVFLQQSVAKALIGNNPACCLHFGLDDDDEITMDMEEWIPGVSGSTCTPSRAAITEV